VSIIADEGLRVSFFALLWWILYDFKALILNGYHRSSCFFEFSW